MNKLSIILFTIFLLQSCTDESITHVRAPIETIIPETPTKPAPPTKPKVPTKPETPTTPKNPTKPKISPIIASIKPSYGSATGGTSIAITGSGFVKDSTVTIGGVACTTLTINSDMNITCIVPAGSAGEADMVISNPDLQTFTLKPGFTYTIPPSVKGIAPDNGFVGGGTIVTITGTGFLSNVSVDLGGSNCIVSTVKTSQITCITTTHTKGVVDLKVSNPDGLAATLANAYTYNLAPSITSITPNGGSPAGGTVITIEGNGFVSGITADLGGISCSPVVFISTTQITCTTPAKTTGVVSLTLTNPDTQTVTKASAYSYANAPTVSTLTPSSGPVSGGTSIKIAGTGFLNGATATLGKKPCLNVVFVNSTLITCTTPSGTGTSNMVVTNPDTQVSTQNVEFIYTPPPTFTSIAPTIGLTTGGDTVVITGSNFLSNATVSLGGAVCTPNDITDTQISCVTSPRTAGTVGITITNPDNQSITKANVFTYSTVSSTITITKVTPNGGPLSGGTEITIDGNNFVTGATITLGGVSCTSISFISSTQLTCSTPASTSGAVDVIVTNPNTQTGTLNEGYTYRPAPTITNVTPTAGPSSGGSRLTITGTGFVTDATAMVGDIACSTNSLTATQIVCTTGTSTSTGSKDVIVSNPDTQSATLADIYTYALAPTITSISPTFDIPAGGRTAIITGSNFVSGSSVTIGGNPCPQTGFGKKFIYCNIPSGKLNTTVDVVVTNPYSLTDTLVNGFGYRDTAILEWDFETYNYPESSTNITNTFTLRNNGTATSSTITVSIYGGESTAFQIGTDNCSGTGNELAAAGTCTVEVTFLASNFASSQYSAFLRAVATIGGDTHTTNLLIATVP